MVRIATTLGHSWPGLALVLCLGTQAQAAQVCTLDGQPINPSNGATLAGKTGIMRCQDGADGPLLREEELRNGRMVGAVRLYRQGILYREYSVNARGSRDGLHREYAASKGANPLLQEETYRDGVSVGVMRAWFHSGQLRMAGFRGQDGREQAAAEFTERGALSDLRCAPKPLLGPHVDDAALCGHAAVSNVEFAGKPGSQGARATFEAGVRTRYETLFANGHPRDQQELRGKLLTERSFSSNGNKQRETQWALEAGQRRKILEQDYHESGALRREQRFAGGTLVGEQVWYANGQPRERTDFQRIGNDQQRYVRNYHDNGQLSFEGLFKVLSRYEEHAIGVHRMFDESGRVRTELHHDPRGRVNRERRFGQDGKAISDEELFEDGSRKSRAR